MNPNDYFSPARPLWHEDNMRQFIGRDKQMKAALNAFGMKGSTLFIHGDRGIGKTSFGWHLREILETGGSGASPKNWVEYARWSKLQKAEVLWLQCRSDMPTIASVIVSLMQPGAGVDRTLYDLCPSILSNSLQVENIERTTKIIGGFFSAETKTHKGTSKRSETDAKLIELSGIENQAKTLFFDMLSKVRRTLGSSEIFIFLDEFDLLPNREFFGRLIKECNDARFVFVGLTEHIETLYLDHPSVARKMIASDIEIPSLSKTEVNEVLDVAEGIGRRDGYNLIFDMEYRDSIYLLTGGFPNLLQYMAYETLTLLKGEPGQTENRLANRKIFEEAKDRLFSPRNSTHDIRRLRNVIGANQKKARIVEVLASMDFGWNEEVELREKLKPSDRDGYDRNMQSLINEMIFKRHDGRIAFLRPELKLLVSVANENGVLLTKGKRDD